MAVTEYPDVAGESNVAIEPGMVLTMEPGMWTAEGMFHCEHNVLVTTAGNEILSDSPLELRRRAEEPLDFLAPAPSACGHDRHRRVARIGETTGPRLVHACQCERGRRST